MVHQFMRGFERGGLPVRAALHLTGLYLALREIEPEQLQDPLMHHTVARCRAPETFVHVPFGELGKSQDEDAPAGLIFHVGRCGSTLLSQLLKRRPDTVVYSEPLPINEILTPPQRWPRKDMVAGLRGLAGAFRRHADAPYVMKFSSWNTLFCDVLVEAFPRTPWVFNYRDPVEAIAPLAAKPPPWLRDDAATARAFSELIDPNGASKSSEELLCRSYGAFCDAIGRLDPRRGKLVPYESLPAAAWEVVAPHFSLPMDVALERRMAAGAGVYAKARLGQPARFVSDSAGKQAAASTELRQKIALYAQPRLERLQRSFEAFRRASV